MDTGTIKSSGLRDKWSPREERVRMTFATADADVAASDSDDVMINMYVFICL